MLIENEVLNVRVVGEQKSSGLSKKLGDYCLGFSMAAGIAMFAEVVLKSETIISVEKLSYCIAGVVVLFISGIFFSVKGGK